MNIPPTTVIYFTGRQKLALRLFREGLSRRGIAARLNVKHERSVSRLLAHARNNERALRRAVQALSLRKENLQESK